MNHTHTPTQSRARRLTRTANSLWHTNFAANNNNNNNKQSSSKKRKLHSSSHRFGTLTHTLTCLCVSSVFDHSLKRNTNVENASQRESKESSLSSDRRHTDTNKKQCNFSVFFSVCFDFLLVSKRSIFFFSSRKQV